jgi:hypothetical protein
MRLTKVAVEPVLREQIEHSPLLVAARPGKDIVLPQFPGFSSGQRRVNSRGLIDRLPMKHLFAL